MRYTTEHALDVRRHVRLPWARYSLVLRCGRDYQPREPAFRGHAVALAALFARIALMVVL